MSLLTTLERHERTYWSTRLRDRVPTLELTAEKLAAMGGPASSPPGERSLDLLLRRFYAALANSTLDSLSPRDWRALPWALWHDDPCLAGVDGAMDALEARLRGKERQRELRSLIEAWLLECGSEKPGLDRVVGILRDLVPRRDWPWATRHARFALFDPRLGPSRVAEHVLGSVDIGKALADLGLRAAPPHQGFARMVLLIGLERLKKRLAGGAGNAAEIDRIVAWAIGDDQPAADIRGPLAEALLEPWLERAPSGELHQRIEKLVLKHYGDPRIKPRNWLGVSDTARIVFTRWLVKLALDQFLNVIDRLAFQFQWKYRRAFWMAYYGEGMIDEAHVMFGQDGYRMARQMFDTNVPCARLETTGKLVLATHAVLLMRIGRLVIADWSHNGKCVMWLDSARNTPRFDKTSYGSGEVSVETGDHHFAEPHAGSTTYAWQRKFRDHIRDRTGIFVPDHAFKVR